MDFALFGSLYAKCRKNGGKWGFFSGKMGENGKLHRKNGEIWGKMGEIWENIQGKVEKHTGENMFSSIPADGSWM